MADQYVKLPDGSYAKFPDSMNDEQIASALKASAPSPTWSDKLGLNEPTPPGTPVQAGLKGAAAGAVDLAQGVTGAAGRTVMGAVDLGNTMRGALGMPQVQPKPGVREAVTQVPDTFSGQTGRALETGAELAAGGIPGGAAVADALPSTARAKQGFQAVMSAAREVPVELGGKGGVGDVALRIKDLADRGGSLPKAVNDLLKYATDPKKPALTYEVARDFASNISRLSVNEITKLTPVMQREVAELRVVLNKAVGQAAGLAGKGQEYANAMNEYARAMRARQFLGDTLKRYAIPASAGAAGGYVLDRVLSGAKGLFGE